MDKILSINTIKNVFAALGAKTSDDNYGVALLDKTSGEPKGLMGIGELTSVLGGINGYKPIKNMTGSNPITINGTQYYYGTYFHLGDNGGFGLAVATVYNSTTGKDELFTAWINNQNVFDPDTATWHKIY